MNSHLETRILACPTLPTLPAVALEVLSLCERDDVDLGRLGDVVSRDPAIAAKLMRLANSASLATRGKVSTLTRAVTLLGLNATVSVALSFSLVRGRRRQDASGFDHGAFWRRSLFAALAGRALGETCGVEPDEAFLAALLQDIGMLALREVFPLQYGDVCRSADGDHEILAALERELLGVDHVEAGALLAHRWNLPDTLCDAIAASHQHGDPGAPLLDVVFLSGRLADVWTGRAPAAAVRHTLAGATRSVRVSPELVRTALSRMALAVPEAAADFDIDLGDPAAIEGIMAQARAVLAARPGAAAPVEASGPVLVEDIVHAVGEALEHASAHRHPLAVAVVGVPGAGSPEGLHAIVASSLRRTDALGPWRGMLIALLPDTRPDGAEAVAARIRARSASVSLDAAVGIAALEPGDVWPRAEALLAAARADLEGAEGAPPGVLAAADVP
jgi:HD-like signal output (HDOD) protein